MSSFPFKPVSRRTFVRRLGIGAAGSALSLSAGRLVPAALAQSQQEKGFITLDGILVTYFSVPPGEPESTSWTLLKKYSTTFTLKSAENPEIAFKASVGPGQESFGSRGSQMNSSLVNNAISLFPGGGDPLSTTTFDPVFYVLINPRLFIKGTADRLRFRIEDMSHQFTLYASDLRFGNMLSADTATSMGRQYITDPALLVGPRFALHETTDVPQLISLPGNVAAGPALTATVTSKIVRSEGFQSDIVKQALAVGADLEITYYSVQEIHAQQILTMRTMFDSASPVVSRIYEDRLFKTFVVT